ncbi:MAG: YfiR family protein [Campylobacterota bacterium]|nr:YfiR family protein [Campylobacterota bacterium]
MSKIFKLLFTLMIFAFTVNANVSEDKLKVLIVGKVAKFISWEKSDNKNFVITILNNPFGDMFDKAFKGKKIKKKDVEIKYIDNIDQLGFTNILYISNKDSKNLDTILERVKGKNILTVSGIRGFAQKKGAMQIYFASQKVKLKINLDTAKEDNLKIKSSLLRIADVIRGDDS